MKIIVTSLLTGIMSLGAAESSGQVASNIAKVRDSTQYMSVRVRVAEEGTPSAVYNDLPLMPKKKESSNKLLLEDKKVLKKGQVKRRYKKERKMAARLVKKRDNRHGIMAERKRKDRMFN
jgi:hypothetical protein